MAISVDARSKAAVCYFIRDGITKNRAHGRSRLALACRGRHSPVDFTLLALAKPSGARLPRISRGIAIKLKEFPGKADILVVRIENKLPGRGPK